MTTKRVKIHTALPKLLDYDTDLFIQSKAAQEKINEIIFFIHDLHTTLDATSVEPTEGESAHSEKWEEEFAPPIVPIEQLIEACGDRFGALHRRFDSSFKLLCWEAVGYNSAGEMITFDGPDPVTAVSRLWLALNAK